MTVATVLRQRFPLLRRAQDERRIVFEILVLEAEAEEALLAPPLYAPDSTPLAGFQPHARGSCADREDAPPSTR